MRFYTQDDLLRAALAMLVSSGMNDRQLLGSISGIKRRARCRAVIAFAKTLDPAPPDSSITTMRAILSELFGRGISNNDLHKHFSTQGRKANDRVELGSFSAWYHEHKARFKHDAELVLADLNGEWPQFTLLAALEAGKLRKKPPTGDV